MHQYCIKQVCLLTDEYHLYKYIM